MKNPATDRIEHDFNAFTQAIKDKYTKHGEKTTVRLRNGSYVDVYWFASDGPEWESLASDTGGCWRWNNDGTSITSEDFDMMETVRIK